MTNTSFLFPKITFIPYITHSPKVHLMFFFFFFFRTVFNLFHTNGKFYKL